MITIQAPAANFVQITTSVTTKVARAPTPLISARRRQPGSCVRSQYRTMPVWESVKAVKTPIT